MHAEHKGSEKGGLLRDMQRFGVPVRFHLLASLDPAAIDHNNAHYFHWTHLEKVDELRGLKEEDVKDALVVLEDSIVTDEQLIRDTNGELPLGMQETHA